MASLAPPVPPALASFLSTLLPCGFAVGPSQLCGGRMGLWWVGRSLEAGSLLGRDGDTEWASKYHSQDDELTMNSESKIGQTSRSEAEQVNRVHIFKMKNSTDTKHTESAVISIKFDCSWRFFSSHLK